MDIQLLHDVCPMRLHRLHTDEECLGYLPVGVAFSDQLQDLPVSVSSQVEGGFGLACLHLAQIGIYQGLRNGRA